MIGTTFETRFVWKVNSFTLHALLVIKSYSLLHNDNVYSIHLLRSRDRLPPHSVKWSKAVLVVNRRHLFFFFLFFYFFFFAGQNIVRVEGMLLKGEKRSMVIVINRDVTPYT